MVHTPGRYQCSNLTEPWLVLLTDWALIRGPEFIQNGYQWVLLSLPVITELWTRSAENQAGKQGRSPVIKQSKELANRERNITDIGSLCARLMIDAPTIRRSSVVHGDPAIIGPLLIVRTQLFSRKTVVRPIPSMSMRTENQSSRLSSALLSSDIG